MQFSSLKVGDYVTCKIGHDDYFTMGKRYCVQKTTQSIGLPSLSGNVNLKIQTNTFDWWVDERYFNNHFYTISEIRKHKINRIYDL